MQRNSPAFREAWIAFLVERPWLQKESMRSQRGHCYFAFRAAWHARKIAELNTALETPAAKIFGRGWARQLREEREAAATAAAMAGRNWFRDSTGKLWVDVPAAAISFGIPSDRPLTVDEARRIYEYAYWPPEKLERLLADLDADEFFESGLDAGIPVG